MLQDMRGVWVWRFLQIVKAYTLKICKQASVCCLGDPSPNIQGEDEWPGVSASVSISVHHEPCLEKTSILPDTLLENAGFCWLSKV